MTARSRNALKAAVRRIPSNLVGLVGFAAGAGLVLGAACVPPGSAGPFDAGSTATTAATAATATIPPRPSQPVLTTVFEDDFERSPGPPPSAAVSASASAAPSSSALTLLDAAVLADAGLGGRDGGLDAGALREAGAGDAGALLDASLASAASAASAAPDASRPDLKPKDIVGLGPNWTALSSTAWRIEAGRLCGEGAKNHGIWLNKTLPVNARIEFDAVSDSTEGDLKAELWGDGKSGATQESYVNATSYLTILGGWKNTFHVLARINEHADNRKEIKVDATSDDPRAKPVIKGQVYHFKIERSDGKTIRWFVDGLEYLSWTDSEPLVGPGHDHFGFNEWKVKVCFDNVKVTPLP